MPLHIEVNESKLGTARVALTGSLDTETAPALEERLARIPDSVALLVFDMQDLAYISSAGLRVIFATLKRQKQKGGQVALGSMNAGVRKVFEIVRALPDMTVFRNAAEMDAYLAKFQRPED
ncbi:MAG TPA: STAS domain-containing protein [Dehalococcoidia bacterium]|jgi:anti-sigma B factor antagonist|nr:STAS domain-containing protein [Dehalococcoidia bacterium]